MKVWKHSKNSGFRLTPPPDAERAEWVEVESEKLEAAERVALKIDGLEEKLGARLIDAEKKIDRLNAQLADHAVDRNRDGTVKQVSLTKLFRAIVTKDWSGAEFEREVVSSPKARALATSTDAAGGYMVPAEYLASEFIPLLRAQTLLDKVKARFLTDLRGAPINIPKQSSGGTAYWVADNASITDSTQGTGQLVLMPHKCACLTKISNEFILQANPAAEQFVRDDIAAVLGLAIDLAAFKGSGASGEPLGIYGTSGINTSAATAGTINTLYDIVKECEVDNVNTMDASCAFVTHPTAWNIARKAASAAGYPKQYQGAGYVIPDAAIGWPVFKSSQLGTNDVLFGKFSDLIVAMWGGINFRASQDAGDAFQYDQTWIRATALVDVGVRNAVSFCLNTVFGT